MSCFCYEFLESYFELPSQNFHFNHPSQKYFFFLFFLLRQCQPQRTIIYIEEHWSLVHAGVANRNLVYGTERWISEIFVLSNIYPSLILLCCIYISWIGLICLMQERSKNLWCSSLGYFYHTPEKLFARSSMSIIYLWCQPACKRLERLRE